MDDYKSKVEWKRQLVMRVIFVSFIDKNETQVMHTKSDKFNIMNGTDTNLMMLLLNLLNLLQKGIRKDQKQK